MAGDGKIISLPPRDLRSREAQLSGSHAIPSGIHILRPTMEDVSRLWDEHCAMVNANEDPTPENMRAVQASFKRWQSAYARWCSSPRGSE